MCSVCTKELIIPLVAAILGIALPMLVGIIQRIDDKYQSTRLIRLFVKERWTICFLVALFTSLVLLFYSLFAPTNNNDFGRFNSFIDNSLPFLLLIVCLCLIVCLFVVCWLIYVYHDPIRLQERLLHSTISMEKRNAWLEFFVAMLKKNNTDVLRRGYQAFYEWGTDMQKGKTNQMVEYSFDFYDGIITINETLCEQNKKAITIANGSDFITILLDKMQGTIIAPKTFSVIWICLNQQLFYNRQEWVMNYWITAHQYYLFNLPKYYENQKEINLDGSPFLITQEQVQLRDLERKEFFDFHIALGGLLLYRKEYDLLKQIIYYSNSQPPQYVLIPGRFAEIYLLYMDLLSCFPINNYESKYPFLNLQAGIRNENIIKGWILKYLILLMLRLYTVVETYSTYNSFGLPGIPQKLMEKKVG
nr:MAG TPA: putative membrane protein [Caudoviricetes sp.]